MFVLCFVAPVCEVVFQKIRQLDFFFSPSRVPLGFKATLTSPCLAPIRLLVRGLTGAAINNPTENGSVLVTMPSCAYVSREMFHCVLQGLLSGKGV